MRCAVAAVAFPDFAFQFDGNGARKKEQKYIDWMRKRPRKQPRMRLLLTCSGSTSIDFDFVFDWLPYYSLISGSLIPPCCSRDIEAV